MAAALELASMSILSLSWTSALRSVLVSRLLLRLQSACL